MRRHTIRCSNYKALWGFVVFEAQYSNDIQQKRRLSRPVKVAMYAYRLTRCCSFEGVIWISEVGRKSRHYCDRRRGRIHRCNWTGIRCARILESRLDICQTGTLSSSQYNSLSRCDRRRGRIHRCNWTGIRCARILESRLDICQTGTPSSSHYNSLSSFRMRLWFTITRTLDRWNAMEWYSWVYRRSVLRGIRLCESGLNVNQAIRWCILVDCSDDNLYRITGGLYRHVDCGWWKMKERRIRNPN